MPQPYDVVAQLCLDLGSWLEVGGQHGRQLSEAWVGPGTGVAVHDVAEHGAGLDGRQLVGVAHEYEPRLGPQSLQEPRHHRQRDHRRLVDDNDVERQPVVAVVAEPALRVGPPAEQPVQRRRGRLRWCRETCRRHALGCGRHRFLQPRRGLAGGRGKRDPLRTVGEGGQRGEQSGHRRRLAGARAARDRGHQAGDGRCDRKPLVVGRRAVGVELGEDAEQPLLVDVNSRPAGTLGQRGAHQLFLPPVAVEVEQAVDQTQGPVGRAVDTFGDRGTRAAGDEPIVGLRPRQRRGVSVDFELADRVAHAAQVDADRSLLSDGSHGERNREQHLLIGLICEPAQSAGDVDVGDGEHTCRVELGEQSRRPLGQPDAVLVDRDGHRSPPSRSADAATTSEAGGFHSNTPHVVPPTTGVCGPLIPRTNR